MLGGGSSGEDEDPGSNDGSNSEENELPGAESFDKAFLVFRFVLKVGDLFGPEKLGEESHVNLPD